MKIKNVILFVLCFLASVNVFSQDFPIAEKGVIDLRDYNFEDDDLVELKGEWEFYWKKLYTPKNFTNNNITPDTYLGVPEVWTDLELNNKILPDTGYATYRLIILLPDNHPELSIKFGEIVSSFKAWFNNKKIVEMGKVGKNSNTAVPQTRPVIVNIPAKTSKSQLILQVSNYDHRNNGLYLPPVIGESDTLLRKFIKNLAFDIIIIGITIIMSLYHLGLFIFRRKNYAALTFSILTLILAIRIGFTSHFSLPYFFHGISWHLTYFFSYFTYYALIAFFTAFMKFTFNEKNYKWFFYSVYIFSAIYMLTLLLPSRIYTKLLLYYQIFNFAAIAVYMYLLFRYVKMKKKGAILLLVTFSLVFFTGINDILNYNYLISTIILLPLGIFILILGQSLTLARIFNNAFDENEKLTQKLDYQNKNLQKIVNQRTKEIQEQKQDILQKNEELQVQKEELQVQKDEIVRQKDLLEYKNKFITDSINYASTIQKAVLPANEDIKKYFNSFIIFIPKDIVSGDFYFFSDYHRKYNFVSVGDCTGHGVPGAFLSLIGMYILNSVIIERQRIDPKDILNQLEFQFNKFLHKGLNENRDGMELGIFRFDKNSQSVVYAAAKTNMFIYDKKDKSLKRYRGTRKSIGVNMALKSKEIEFENYNFLIDKNKVLYCATDGFVDQSNDQRNRFGTKRFMRMLKNVGDLPVQQQKISIIKTLEQHKENQDQRDDITLIGLISK